MKVFNIITGMLVFISIWLIGGMVIDSYHIKPKDAMSVGVITYWIGDRLMTLTIKWLNKK